MQEMVELSKGQSVNTATELQSVFFKKSDDTYEILMAGPSHFSPELVGDKAIRQKVAYAIPLTLCSGIIFSSTYISILFRLNLK